MNPELNGWTDETLRLYGSTNPLQPRWFKGAACRSSNVPRSLISVRLLATWRVTALCKVLVFQIIEVTQEQLLIIIPNKFTMQMINHLLSTRISLSLQSKRYTSTIPKFQSRSRITQSPSHFTIRIIVNARFKGCHIYHCFTSYSIIISILILVFLIIGIASFCFG